MILLNGWYWPFANMLFKHYSSSEISIRFHFIVPFPFLLMFLMHQDCPSDLRAALKRVPHWNNGTIKADVVCKIRGRVFILSLDLCLLHLMWHTIAVCFSDKGRFVGWVRSLFLVSLETHQYTFNIVDQGRRGAPCWKKANEILMARISTPTIHGEEWLSHFASMWNWEANIVVIGG